MKSTSTSETTRQFAEASRNIEWLLKVASESHLQKDAKAIAGWIQNVNHLLENVGRLIASEQPRLNDLKSAPEVKHYKAQLDLLKQQAQNFERSLRAHTAELRREQQQRHRVRAWANAVSNFV